MFRNVRVGAPVAPLSTPPVQKANSGSPSRVNQKSCNSQSSGPPPEATMTQFRCQKPPLRITHFPHNPTITAPKKPAPPPGAACTVAISQAPIAPPPQARLLSTYIALIFSESRSASPFLRSAGAAIFPATRIFRSRRVACPFPSVHSNAGKKNER